LGGLLKVKFISPSLIKSNPKLQWYKQPRAHRYPGLGLLIVASLCPPSIEIKLVDDEFENINYEEETDLVGISVYTTNAYRGYEISRNFRDRNVPVVMGGMHVTACPEEASKHADSIVVGEAEDTWPELLRDFSSGKLKKVYNSSNSSDLSNMPFPRRDLLDKRRYIIINTIQATRGCTFNCEFCSITGLFGSKIRCRPVEEVIEEIKSLDGDIFLLNDDNLAQNKEYFKELFRKLIPLKKRWIGEASWNIAKDDETLDLLEKSGCRGLAIGFESVEPQYGVKKIIRSRDIIPLYKEVVKKLHNHKIIIMGNFIFGFDNDNESTFDKTLKFILESQIDTAQFSILKPFPGTPLYRRLEEEGRITDKNWNNYMGWHLCFKLKNMTRRAFLKKFYWMTSQFNSYPRIVLRIIRTVRRASLKELGTLLAINLGHRKSVSNYFRKLQQPFLLQNLESDLR